MSHLRKRVCGLGYASHSYRLHSWPVGSRQDDTAGKVDPGIEKTRLSGGTIKHHAHPGFEIDHPGKDTWRHAQAGSDHVLIAASDKVASIRRVDRELTLDEIAATISDVHFNNH
jgi:hypothetical protein